MHLIDKFTHISVLVNLDIIYEDAILLVCNKPAGLMVEPDRNNHPNLLQQVKNYLKQTTNEKLPYAQHLHRLDRVTSGLVLFTKNKDYLRNLSEQFAQRQIKKEYVALTAAFRISDTEALEMPDILKAPITLTHWHRKEKKKAVLFDEEMPFTEKVVLDYVVEPYDEFFKWHIQLHTGKYHQIRAQLANIGYPIIGDALYGSKIEYKENAIALCATKLIITHPVTQQELVFETTFL